MDSGGRGDVTSCRPSTVGTVADRNGSPGKHPLGIKPYYFNKSHFQLFIVLGDGGPPSCDSYSTCSFIKIKVNVVLSPGKRVNSRVAAALVRIRIGYQNRHTALLFPPSARIG